MWSCLSTNIVIPLVASVWLFCTPVNIVSMNVPDWSIVTVYDYRSTLTKLDYCKNYKSYLKENKLYDVELHDNNRNAEWSFEIEVNFKSGGFSCLAEFRNFIITKYITENGELMSYEELESQMHIKYYSKNKNNRIRYLFLIMAIVALGIKRNSTEMR
jgi:hypothetical protein